MLFLDIPNIPDQTVSFAVVDGRIHDCIESVLLENGVALLKTSQYKGVYASISYHPDIALHHLGGNRIVYAPGVDNVLLRELDKHGFMLIRGESELSSAYPGNIAYNAARVGKFFFHNLKYTDPVLLKELEREAIQAVGVKQGYAKCSISVIDENAIITSDKGIANAAEKVGVEALLIGEEKNIQLPGLNYGFIGGATGLISRKKWAITGNLSNLASYDRIKNFLSKKDMEIVCLSDGLPLDIGSIIPLLQNNISL